MTWLRTTSLLFRSTIVPTPSSELVLHNSSNTHTYNNTLTVGEYATFAVRISVPEGLTNNITVQINSSASDPTAELWVVGASLSLPSTMSTPYSYSTQIGANSFIRIPSLYNAADNKRDNGDVALVFLTCMPLLPTVNGINFTINSQFRHTGNKTIVETTKSTVVEIVQPRLAMKQWCTPESGDAGDEFACTIHIEQLEQWVCFML